MVIEFLACQLLCCRYVCGQRGLVTLEKQWQSRPSPFAYQTIVKVSNMPFNLIYLNFVEAMFV